MYNCFSGIALPWRWLAASATVLPALLMFLSIFIVETPRYLLLKGKAQKAKESLQLLRGKNVILGFLFVISELREHFLSRYF